jgi:hypothetical protein
MTLHRRLAYLPLAAALLLAGATIGARAQNTPTTPTTPMQMPMPMSGHHMTMKQRFEAANTTHDGKLTKAQADAGMPMVARHFAAIDVDHDSTVTLPEIRKYMKAHRAEIRSEMQQMRAQQPPAAGTAQ